MDGTTLHALSITLAKTCWPQSTSQDPQNSDNIPGSRLDLVKKTDGVPASTADRLWL